jgi:dihydroorotate dehydrogenase electron transfer subunit
MNNMKKCSVLKNEPLSDDVYSLWLQAGIMQWRAGQFVMVYPNDASKLLGRPISICEGNASGDIRLVYRVVGAGTGQFASLVEGESVDILGPLGNGFPQVASSKQQTTDEIDDSHCKSIDSIQFLEVGASAVSKTDNVTRSILFGGGIGIPPMLGLAKSLPGEKIFFAGYRDAHTFLADEARVYVQTVIATDDGSVGFHGNVVSCAEEYFGTQEGGVPTIYACGPLGLLKAVKSFAQERGYTAYISLEERMACGIGACLG